MIYVTGDTHGDYSRIESFCQRFNTTKNDHKIVLGDNGVNYWGGKRDKKLKKKLESLPITFMMIRGNHDQRPSKKIYADQYVYGGCYGARWAGRFLLEKDFPSLLFAIDGEYYNLSGNVSLVIGGAYSVDKWYRLEMQERGCSGYRWFPDEQLSPNEREEILSELKHYVRRTIGPDIILSHTCPHRHIPKEMFLGIIDQATVDDTMERWLNEVEDCVPDCQWYCGHWHTNKKDGNIHFMYGDIISL